jgi:hypothetical protein
MRAENCATTAPVAIMLVGALLAKLTQTHARGTPRLATRDPAAACQTDEQTRLSTSPAATCSEDLEQMRISTRIEAYFMELPREGRIRFNAPCAMICG